MKSYKKFLLVQPFLICLITSAIVGCRNTTRRSYEVFGLASKKEVISSLKLGLPVVVSGLLLFLLASKLLANQQSEKFSIGHVFIYLGIAAIIAGVIILFPVIGWFEAIVGGILNLITAIFLIGALIVLLVLFINKIRDRL